MAFTHALDSLYAPALVASGFVGTGFAVLVGFFLSE
jgi:hypothetical protein